MLWGSSAAAVSGSGVRCEQAPADSSRGAQCDAEDAFHRYRQRYESFRGKSVPAARKDVHCAAAGISVSGRRGAACGTCSSAGERPAAAAQGLRRCRAAACGGRTKRQRVAGLRAGRLRPARHQEPQRPARVARIRFLLRLPGNSAARNPRPARLEIAAATVRIVRTRNPPHASGTSDRQSSLEKPRAPPHTHLMKRLRAGSGRILPEAIARACGADVRPGAVRQPTMRLVSVSGKTIHGRNVLACSKSMRA